LTKINITRREILRTALAAPLLWLLSPLRRIWAAETYTVQPNDTLGAIAERFGLRASDLASFNSMANPNSLEVGQVLQIPPKGGVKAAYVVKDGDSLSRIAEKHGVTTGQLIEANDLTNPDSLAVGQKLVIPPPLPGQQVKPAAPSLPAGVKRLIDRPRIRPSRWKYIVVHHSATSRGNAKDMDRYHREKRHMENGLAYHFVIGNGKGAPNGAIEVGRRWSAQLNGGHLASEALNAKSIGICLVGDFNKTYPTEQQMRSLHALIHYLCLQCGLGASAIKTHRQINTKPTQCPGKKFPTAKLAAYAP